MFIKAVQKKYMKIWYLRLEIVVLLKNKNDFSRSFLLMKNMCQKQNELQKKVQYSVLKFYISSL